jgi:hypothetical protein
MNLIKLISTEARKRSYEPWDLGYPQTKRIWHTVLAEVKVFGLFWWEVHRIWFYIDEGRK